MENRFNNYALHRAAEVFKDVNLPPKNQEAFDLWPKVRKLIATSHEEIVGGHYYTLLIPEGNHWTHLSLRAFGKAYKIDNEWCIMFKVLGDDEYDEDGNINIVAIAMNELSGRLYRSTGNSQRFLKLTAQMHPAQFYCVVTGEHYTQELFNEFRETQL